MKVNGFPRRDVRLWRVAILTPQDASLKRFGASLRRSLLLGILAATLALAAAIGAALLAVAYAESPEAPSPSVAYSSPNLADRLADVHFVGAQAASSFAEVAAIQHEAQVLAAVEEPLPPAARYEAPPRVLASSEPPPRLITADEPPPPHATLPLTLSPVKSSPMMQISQRMEIPGKGDVFVKGLIQNTNVTFYDCADQGFCGAMYNGRKVYEGAAACSWNLAIGTRFFIVGDPTNRIYICEDRGLLSNTWVDIFWHHPADGYRWQAKVGRFNTIVIVE